MLLPLSHISIAMPQVSALQEAQGFYNYTFLVMDNGTSLIVISFSMKGRPLSKYSSWVYLPRNLTNVKVIVNQGKILNYTVHPTGYYFYSQYTFNFTPNENGSFISQFTYKMNYAALIIEPEGAFVSPLIRYSPSSKGEATVIIPDYVELKYFDPIPGLKEKKNNKLILRYLLSPQILRIYLLFKVNWKPDITNISVPPFTVITPHRYMSEARALISVYSKTYPLIRDIIGIELKNVTIRLFVPSELSEFSILGFVPFNPRISKIGEIHLNIFYLRAIKGILEYGAIHELIHHILWKLKVMPEVLWVHEGLAEYLGITLVRLIDTNGTFEDGLRWREKLLNDYVQRTRGNFNFLLRWRPGVIPVNDVLLCYASAYTIFRTLGDRYSLSLYKRLFKLIRSLNFPLSSSALFIELLNEAAGEDLSPYFKRWGFNVLRVSTVLKIAHMLPPLMEDPFNILKPLAKWGYSIAMDLLEKGLYEKASVWLNIALIITLLGKAVIFLASTYIVVSLILLLLRGTRKKQIFTK